ncbi:MAG: hypothetical protein ACRDZZ_02655, partial [Ilumatobacteraceae bacterium]
MSMADALDRGRESFSRQAWKDAFAQLSAADDGTTLEVEDLELLAVAAYLIGDDEAAAAAWTRAHHSWLDAANMSRAVRCAFWLGLRLMLKGDMAQSGGWFARARRLLADGRME